MTEKILDSSKLIMPAVEKLNVCKKNLILCMQVPEVIIVLAR